jgi:hypothetical protein
MIVIKWSVFYLFQVSTTRIAVVLSPSIELEVRATYVLIEIIATFFLTSENGSK